MKNSLIVTFALLVQVFGASAQLNLTRYHLGNNIVIGQEQNAAFFPRTKFYLSFPGISNINFDFNSPVAYSDLFEVTGDSVLVKLDSYLNNEKNDFVSFETTVPIFGFGFRINEISNASFFINSRNSFAFGIPKDLPRWIYNGNGEYVGSEYEVDDIAFKAISYAEVGVQYTRDITIAGLEFTGGARLKYLAGLGVASLNNRAQVNITTDNLAYKTTFNFEDATIRVAGFDIDDDDEIEEGITEGDLGGGGFALDFGAMWYYDDKWTFNFAVNDLGMISWNNAAKEINLIDQSFVLEGANVDSNDFETDLEENLDDSYETDTLSSSFVTGLTPSIYMGATYKVGKNGYASATYANTFDLGRLRNAIGIGYTQNLGRIVSVSTTVSRTPQQPVDVGLGMGLLLGGFHFHIMGDGLIRALDLTQVRKANVGFGLNFSIGNPDKVKKEKKKKEIKIDTGKKYE